MALPPSAVKDLIRLCRGSAGHRRERARIVLRACLRTKMRALKRSERVKKHSTVPSSTPIRSYRNRPKKPEGLLALPLELRDAIYIFVLREGTVEVNAALRTPGLLAVNKQIRREARPIYLHGNIFEYHMRQWDGGLWFEWIRVSFPFKPRHNVYLHISYNWVHLKMLMRAVWTFGTPYPFNIKSADTHITSVFFCALRITEAHKGLGWAQCDNCLDELYGVLVLLEPSWRHQTFESDMLR